MSIDHSSKSAQILLIYGSAQYTHPAVLISTIVLTEYIFGSLRILHARVDTRLARGALGYLVL